MSSEESATREKPTVDEAESNDEVSDQELQNQFFCNQADVYKEAEVWACKHPSSFIQRLEAGILPVTFGYDAKQSRKAHRFWAVGAAYALTGLAIYAVGALLEDLLVTKWKSVMQ